MALGGRGITWLLYGPTMVASSLFCIISLVTFGDLAQVQYEPSAGHLASQLNGALAASFMAPVLTAGLLITSFFVLVKKSWSRSGGFFTYGFMSNSLFLLLAGVVLTAIKHNTPMFEQSPMWSSSASNALVVSFVLAFIAAGFQLVQAASMIANRHSFSGGAQLTVDELGMSPLRTPGSPGSSGMTPQAAAPAAPGSTGAWNTGVSV